MALVFPVSLGGFFGGIAQAALTFSLSESVATSETGGGEILRVDYGPRLWQGTVEVVPLLPNDAAEVMAQVEVLQAARASFLACPYYESSLASGTIYDMRNGREIRIGGLPANATLRRGQYLSFTYGADPIRYALHQLAENATAGVNGITGWVELTSLIRDGAQLGAAVALDEPVCKAIMVPGTFTPMMIRNGAADGCSFQWRQTLR